MHDFWHRYRTDTSAPTAQQVRHDLVHRVLLPAVVLWCVVVGLGLLITGPLGDLPGEAGVNEWFVDQRTPTLDAVTTVLSAIGQTEFLIGACVVAIALVWWRTRQWWYAIVPGLAVAVQAAIFLTSALVVGRERPEVEQLDHAPPTSGFPSGHTGAATAFYLSLAFMAQRIAHPVARSVLTALCVLVPVAVGVARAYRGMHSLTDVIVGFLNGATCAVIAWNYVRRDPRRAVSGPSGARARRDYGGGVALFSRRRRLPDPLRRVLDLRADAILASAPLADGRWAVTSRRALHLVGDEGAARTPWEAVDRGSLDAQTSTLTVHWVSGARTELVLESDAHAWDLVQSFRERVQQSVVHVEHVAVPEHRSPVRVALRRDEHGDLFTQVIGDGTIDLTAPGVARRVADAEAHVRAEAGLAP